MALDQSTAQSPTIPVKPTMDAAWERVKGAKGTFWAIFGSFFLFFILLGFIFGMTAGAMGHTAQKPGLLVQLFYIVIQLIFTVCIIYFGVQRARDLPIRFGMIKNVLTDYMLLLKFIGAYFLLVLAMLIVSAVFFGIFFALSYIPLIGGIAHALSFIVAFAAIIYVMIRLVLIYAIVIDQNLNPVAAMKLSWKATENNFWPLFGIFFFNQLIIMASILLLGIGLIWTVPYAIICYGMVYRSRMKALGLMS